MTLVCPYCGSPWFEPEHGRLLCCDCGRDPFTTPPTPVPNEGDTP